MSSKYLYLGRASQPSAHSLPPRRRPRGCRPRARRTPSRVHAGYRSNTTRARSTLCVRPRSRAVPTPSAGRSLEYSVSVLLSDTPLRRRRAPVDTAGGRRCVQVAHENTPSSKRASKLQTNVSNMMQVPAHSITTRRLPRVCVGTVRGNSPAGRVHCLPVTVPPPSGAWGGCRESGQRTAPSDLGAASRGKAELTKHSSAS